MRMEGGAEGGPAKGGMKAAVVLGGCEVTDYVHEGWWPGGLLYW